MTTKLSAQTYKLRRIVQTPRTFSNWTTVLGDMAKGRMGRGPQTLQFQTRDGITIACPNRPGARVPLYEIFAEDCYRLSWLLGRLADRPIEVVDIGGHVGTFANRLAQLHPDARIRSYEPSPTTAGFLRRNVLTNGFEDRVVVIESALSATTGFAVFSDNGAGSGLNGLESTGRTAGTPTQVRTVAFDEVVVSAGRPVDLVKIDCEGGEYDLVLGSDPASWAEVQRVVIEWHPATGHDWSELKARFDECGLFVQHLQTADGYGCAWLSRTQLPPYPG